MTHQLHPSSVEQVIQAISEQGFDGMAQAMQVLLNECMKIERQRARVTYAQASQSFPVAISAGEWPPVQTERIAFTENDYVFAKPCFHPQPWTNNRNLIRRAVNSVTPYYEIVGFVDQLHACYLVLSDYNVFLD